MIRYGSVCSGIEAASTAWHTLGWQPVFFSEIEPFPCSVLATHWPHVPNLGDLTKHESWTHEPIDLLVGGTPCQSFSVAGLREGLADPRGNLTLTFLALVKRTRPRWVVWENVPGVLSDRTNAFGHFLSGLAEFGYGWAYRVLDAQYFGVAQRRRRVFVVACAGADWRRAAAVLFEPDCLRGNPPPSRERGQGFAHDVAPCIGASGRGFERGGDTRWQDPVVACFGGNNRTGPIDAAAALNAKGGSGRMDFESETFIAHTTGAGFWQPGALRAREQESHEHLVAHSLRGEGFDASEDGTGRGTPLVPVAFSIHENQRSEVTLNETVGTIKCAGGKPGQGYPAVAFEPRFTRTSGGQPSTELNHCLRADVNTGDGQPCVMTPTMRVRRLTPRECERLQGFPDDHTRIPWRKRPADECPDGPRYKAIGNSMAVPVMAWIGRRIQNLEKDAS